MRRFSIAALMVVVLVSAVAVAALLNASDLWAGSVLLLTLGMLGFALLGIRQRREAKRAFWEGFAIFGWGYLVLALSPWFVDQVQPNLPTTWLVDNLYVKLQAAMGRPTALGVTNLTFSVNARNITNYTNLAQPNALLNVPTSTLCTTDPQACMNSPFFGTSNSLATGPFSSNGASRLFYLQVGFSF